VLFDVLIRRKKPERMQDVLPGVEKLEIMAVRAQRAGSSFLLAAIPTATVFGVAAALRTALYQSVLLTSACMAWGYSLSWLARHGYLPIPETE
jgi:hypothetical protein